MRSTPFYFAAAVAAALGLWGCGGGGSSPGSVNALANGRAALTGMASGAQPTTAASLQSALTLFQQAIKSNPNSPEARFGEAIALVGICTDQLDGNMSSGNGTGGAGSGSGGSGGTMIPAATSKAALARTRDAGGAAITLPGGAIPGAPSSGEVPPAPPGQTATPMALPPSHTLGLIWFLDRGLSNPYTLLQTLAPIADLHLGLIPFSGYAGDAADVAARETMLTNLQTVLTDLGTVEADSGFTYTLPSPDQNGQTVTIGLPEVYLFDAYVNSLVSQIALSLAYVRDPGNWQPFIPVIPATAGGATGTNDLPPAPPVFNNPGKDVTLPFTYASLDANKDGKLEPNEYLPPSPFLTLRSASFLQTAQTAIAATAAKETLGINGVLARTGAGTFLIPNTPSVDTVLNDILKNVVPLLAQAAVGPVTLQFPFYNLGVLTPIAEGSDNAGGAFQYIPIAATTIDTPPAPPLPGGGGAIMPTLPPVPLVTEEPVTVDLAAWFANPPADLKAFAPTYTLTPDGWIDFTATTYPDKTFGGLFPNGLPQQLTL